MKLEEARIPSQQVRAEHKRYRQALQNMDKGAGVMGGVLQTGAAVGKWAKSDGSKSDYQFLASPLTLLVITNTISQSQAGY